MSFSYPTEWPQFFTASIKSRQPLLCTEKYKRIITDCLLFMVINKRIELNAFVVMDDHLHLIWQPLQGQTLASIQLSFMKFTAQQIKFALAIDDPVALEKCKVNKSDRQYQVWKRKPLSVELSTEKVFMQKLDYIHYNPVRAGLCKFPEEYEFSSALFYETGEDKFGMLTHYLG